jgi:hypothetical protein
VTRLGRPPLDLRAARRRVRHRRLKGRHSRTPDWCQNLTTESTVEVQVKNDVFTNARTATGEELERLCKLAAQQLLDDDTLPVVSRERQPPLTGEPSGRGRRRSLPTLAIDSGWELELEATSEQAVARPGDRGERESTEPSDEGGVGSMDHVRSSTTARDLAVGPRTFRSGRAEPVLGLNGRRAP